jgi:hypothetical protein
MIKDPVNPVFPSVKVLIKHVEKLSNRNRNYPIAAAAAGKRAENSKIGNQTRVVAVGAHAHNG